MADWIEGKTGMHLVSFCPRESRFLDIFYYLVPGSQLCSVVSCIASDSFVLTEAKCLIYDSEVKASASSCSSETDAQCGRPAAVLLLDPQDALVDPMTIIRMKKMLFSL